MLLHGLDYNGDFDDDDEDSISVFGPHDPSVFIECIICSKEYENKIKQRGYLDKKFYSEKESYLGRDANLNKVKTLATDEQRKCEGQCIQKKSTHPVYAEYYNVCDYVRGIKLSDGSIAKREPFISDSILLPLGV
ncbi:MAG: hypothetical protein KJ906_01250 [Nanoarchaeota archaeon]|nr:hypothetical protein [Nanoarchaeota archaeon]